MSSITGKNLFLHRISLCHVGSCSIWRCCMRPCSSLPRASVFVDLLPIPGGCLPWWRCLARQRNVDYVNNKHVFGEYRGWFVERSLQMTIRDTDPSTSITSSHSSSRIHQVIPCLVFFHSRSLLHEPPYRILRIRVSPIHFCWRPAAAEDFIQADHDAEIKEKCPFFCIVISYRY